MGHSGSDECGCGSSLLVTFTTVGATCVSSSLLWVNSDDIPAFETLEEEEELEEEEKTKGIGDFPTDSSEELGTDE